MSVRRPVLLPILSVRGFVVTPSTVKVRRSGCKPRALLNRFSDVSVVDLVLKSVSIVIQLRMTICFKLSVLDYFVVQLFKDIIIIFSCPVLLLSSFFSALFLVDVNYSVGIKFWPKRAIIIL